jgi:hypothetical protein
MNAKNNKILTFTDVVQHPSLIDMKIFYFETLVCLYLLPLPTEISFVSINFYGRLP